MTHLLRRHDAPANRWVWQIGSIQVNPRQAPSRWKLVLTTATIDPSSHRQLVRRQTSPPVVDSLTSGRRPPTAARSVLRQCPRRVDAGAREQAVVRLRSSTHHQRSRDRTRHRSAAPAKPDDRSSSPRPGQAVAASSRQVPTRRYGPRYGVRRRRSVVYRSALDPSPRLAPCAPSREPRRTSQELSGPVHATTAPRSAR